MAKQATKSVTIQTDPTLQALAQLLSPDEADLFALVAKKDGQSPRKALREAFRLHVITTLEDSLVDHPDEAFNKAVLPITRRLGWRREEFGYEEIPGVTLSAPSYLGNCLQ